MKRRKAQRNKNPPFSKAKVKERQLKQFWASHTWITGEYVNGHYQTGRWVKNDEEE